MASQKSNVQDSLRVWYPAEVRERIDDINSKYPGGFLCGKTASELSSGVLFDLATLELQRYMVSLKPALCTYALHSSITDALTDFSTPSGSGAFKEEVKANGQPCIGHPVYAGGSACEEHR